MSDDLIKALKKRIEFDKDVYLRAVEDWKMYWMNQHQNSKADYENYFRRAFGVDSNMAHHLADVLQKSDSTRLQPVLLAMVALVEALEWSDVDLDRYRGISDALSHLKEAVSGEAVDKAIDREDVARSREEPHPGDEQLDLLEWGERNERSNS